MQIGNTNKPNSKNNTYVIAIAKIKDTYTNLNKCMSILRPQLDELSSSEWNGKKIELFVFGDYDFLAKLYGLSGAQGTFPCLWCLQPKSSMMTIQKSPFEARSLASLRKDHERFMMHGHGLKKNVSDYNNSLFPPIINVEPTSVCPPYLHILLGIVLKHHRMLEEATDAIDSELRNRELQDVRDKLFYAKSDVEWSKDDPIFSEEDKENYRKIRKDLKVRFQILKYEKQQARSGPICSELDGILNKAHITPQAYHSRSFIGNHCHKYITENVYKQLTTFIFRKTVELTDDQKIIDQAQVVKTKFNAINEAYHEIHTSISHARPIAQDTIPKIQTSISKYMALYRKNFSKKITPKQHFLENHCVPWIQRYGFGMGFHGEQGGELIHASVAKLERRALGIRNDAAQLHNILKNQHLQTTPALLSSAPTPKKRRKKSL